MTTLGRAAAAAAGLLLAATIATGPALAAPPAPPAPAANNATPVPKILVINRAAILANAKVGQDIVRQVQGYKAAAEKEFKGESDGLKRDQTALQQQVAILAPNVKAQKIKEFQSRAAAFEQKVQMRQAQIEYGVFKARQQVEAAMGPILQGIMNERGANLLLDRQAVVLGTVNIDVTQTAIDRLNQKMPTVKVQLTNPPPEFLRAQQQQGG
ncbi:MAG TPA: OmpH family outer membrane protein [Rhizomicrobium sp.]|nr:OmpH family outer membrane protein [Rhizomicrobium sp.]